MIPKKLRNLGSHADAIGNAWLRLAQQYDCGFSQCDGVDCPEHQRLLALADDSFDFARQLRATMQAAEQKAGVA